jgi:hypothetical protein
VPADAYATLGLLPGAPPALVARAHEFWRAHYASALGTGTKLAEIDEAYAAIRGEAVIG